MTLTTRKQILDKLAEWMGGKLSSVDIHKWATELQASGEASFDDWEQDQSAARESLAELEMLDINMVTSKDAPAFVKFLETPAGEFGPGYISFIEALQKIDVKKRMKELYDTEPYKRHCTEAAPKARKGGK